MRITIRQIPIIISEPYEEGMVMGPAEAKRLNTARAEMIRDNLLRLGIVRKMEEIPNREEWEELQGIVSDYDKNYQIPDGSRGKMAMGGLEEEILLVAGERVRRVLRGKEVSRKELDRMVSREAESGDVYEKARERWLKKKKVAEGALEELME